MVGITMVHGFNDKGISPYRLTHKASRAIKVRHKIFRIFSGVMASIFLVSAVPASVGAMETTKASALVLEELGAKDLSFTKKSPHEAQADPCLPLLHAHRQSPGESAMSFNNRRSVGHKTATPVALGLFLGIRVALGPQDVLKNKTRVQIGPEVRTNQVSGDNYALAVAAYRGCKNKHTLGLLQKD